MKDEFTLNGRTLFPAQVQNDFLVAARAYFAELLMNVKLPEKPEQGIGRHGSSKGDIIEFTLYFDAYHNTWTTEQIALRGYILEHIMPVIKEVVLTHYSNLKNGDDNLFTKMK